MDLKEYLHKEYQGIDSFLENVIFPTFGKSNFQSTFNADMLEKEPQLCPLAKITNISKFIHVGNINVGFDCIYIFDITVESHVQMARNRVSIQKMVRQIMDSYSCSFMIFHYEQDSKWDWRFSFCRKGASSKDITEGKRYTFLLGPSQSCRTVADNLDKLRKKAGDLQAEDLVSAFDVEALSNEFFERYKSFYEDFVAFVTGKRYVKKGGKWVEIVVQEPNYQIYDSFGKDDKTVRDFVKKMLGRIVFLHFLQKKGWMGVPADESWGQGDLQFMKHLYEEASEEQKNDFLNVVLKSLFLALDTNRADSDYLVDTITMGDLKVPYLNGGLFSRDNLDDIDAKFPPEMFRDLLDFLYQYNFTIDENDPGDAQVGIDPEMLGRIFENLLEDNKDKGAYYTPKEIVKYMCRESLKAYLLTDVTDEETKNQIGQFVESYDVKTLGGGQSDLAQLVDEKLKEVKICDPAIGSGAFPMGLLKELFFCRGAIEHFDNAAAIKRHIIQNNIYGVDIERGAVDIARLRFWLSLIIDETTPETLPNLDFKIMQGNSLLESYEGVDLSTMASQKKEMKEGTQIDIFDNIIDVSRRDLRDLLRKFFDCNEHNERISLKQKITNNVLSQLKSQHFLIDLSKIDLLANDKFFLWHTWFNDVFNRPSKQGFDIVIGNPPYIQLQKNGGSFAALYEHCGYKTFVRTGDIYCLFYERGWQLLKRGGYLCYITSNKWMRAAYGEQIRNFFTTKTNPQLLIDFSGVKIFEGATVDANILLFSKDNNRHNTICAVSNDQSKDCIKNPSVFVKQNNFMCNFPNSDSWVILSPIEQRIKRKIEEAGTPLKDWNVNIYRGILTGCNDAFIISTEKRKEILDNCKTSEERRRTEELIRPILRGRDIKRYSYKWANLWLIATFPSRHYDIDLYPAVKNFLSSFNIKRLEQTGKVYTIDGGKIQARKKTNNKWFETQDSISYWDLFFKPKICWKAVGRNLAFAAVESGTFLTAPASFISANNKEEIILAYLCSTLGKYYIYQNSDTTGAGDIMLNIQSLIRFPIPQEDNKYLIQAIKKKDDNKIDDEIFRSYHFNELEINHIKNIHKCL